MRYQPGTPKSPCSFSSLAASRSRFASSEQVFAAKATSLPLRLASSAGNPLANTISDCEANDQSNYNFHWWRLYAPNPRANSAQATYFTSMYQATHRANADAITPAQYQPRSVSSLIGSSSLFRETIHPFLAQSWRGDSIEQWRADEPIHSDGPWCPSRPHNNCSGRVCST